MKRTHLPLNALRVFDAAARHLNFTRAADELAVTPAAVGQQIRALEDVLGVVLFRRTPKGLELTPEAEAGLDALRLGFLKFEESVQAMRAGQSSKALTIAAPRDFTARWLTPRLSTIAAKEPELRFRLIVADQPVDFTEANLDVAVRWTDDAGDLDGQKIDGGGMVRLVPPNGAGVYDICWSGTREEIEGGPPVMHVGDAGLAIDAVANGLGTATVPALLAADDIASGRVKLAEDVVGNSSSYWFVAPTPQWRQKKVRTLIAFLMGDEETV